MKISDNISARIYPDTRPHILEIADLQKGLSLITNGKEIIGEGAGFGVPIVIYEDNVYFSKDATIFFNEDTDSLNIVKSFTIDSVSKKSLGKGVFLNDNIYNLFHKNFEKAYLKWKSFKQFFDKLIELRKLLKINTQFVKGKNKGKIDVYYKFFPDLIKIKICFKKITRKGIKEILILNEQSSTFFRRYFDTDGNQLFDNQIEAWAQVYAKKASFSDIKKSIVFSLHNISGAKLIRGREQIKNRFSWAGFTYSINPNLDCFTYSIFLKENTKYDVQRKFGKLE